MDTRVDRSSAHDPPRLPVTIVSLSPRTAQIAMRYAKVNISKYLQVEGPFEVSTRNNCGPPPLGPSVCEDKFAAKARQHQKRKRLMHRRHSQRHGEGEIQIHERRARVTEPPFYEIDFDIEIGLNSPFSAVLPEGPIASTSDGRRRSLPVTPSFGRLLQDGQCRVTDQIFDVVKTTECYDGSLTEREMKWNQLLTEAVRRARAFSDDS